MDGILGYGLREAKRIIAKMRAKMAADPTQRRSQEPFTRGQRAALNEATRRIDEAIGSVTRRPAK